MERLLNGIPIWSNKKKKKKKKKKESPLLGSYAYEDFKIAMQERYKTCASSDIANSKLTKIKYTSLWSIADYCDYFEKTARDSSFNDEAKIYFFAMGLPVKVQEKIRMIHPRIRKLEELITTVAGNLEIESRIYGTDPMDVYGRRTRPFARGLNVSKYQNTYQSNYNHE
eukprot:jgi/Orpsp1_1/1176705/evm.model.c7180000058676.1